MSIRIKFLMHAFLVFFFIPIMIYTSFNDLFWETHVLEVIGIGFVYSLLYIIAVKLYPYNDACVGMKLDYQFVRILLIVAIVIITCWLTSFLHDTTADKSFVVVPLCFYFGAYYYFRKHWAVLFSSEIEKHGKNHSMQLFSQLIAVKQSPVPVFDIKEKFLPDNDDIVDAYESYNGEFPEKRSHLRRYVAYYMSGDRFYEDSSRMALIKSYLYESALIHFNPPLPTWDDLGPKTKFVMCSLIDAAMNKDGSIKKYYRFQPVELIEHVRRVMHRNPYSSFDLLFSDTSAAILAANE